MENFMSKVLWRGGDEEEEEEETDWFPIKSAPMLYPIWALPEPVYPNTPKLVALPSTSTSKKEILSQVGTDTETCIHFQLVWLCYSTRKQTKTSKTIAAKQKNNPGRAAPAAIITQYVVGVSKGRRRKFEEKKSQQFRCVLLRREYCGKWCHLILLSLLLLYVIITIYGLIIL